MNHDVAHCLDYNRRICPSTCPKAALEIDLQKHMMRYIGIPLTYASFKDEAICRLRKEANDER